MSARHGFGPKISCKRTCSMNRSQSHSPTMASVAKAELQSRSIHSCDTQCCPKVATEKYQILALSVAQMQVVSLYLSPLVPKEVFSECLNTAHKSCRSKAVIMGDFNAHHRTWDRTSNSHGRWLAAWAKNHSWVIHAPSEPTFSSHRSSSTVDLSGLLSRVKPP